MASEGMNLGLAIYAGAIAWVSMALLGVNRRFLDQHSRFWFGLHRIVSAGGGVVGAWIFAQLPVDKSLSFFTIASILGGYIASDIYNIATGSVSTPGVWTPAPWGLEPPLREDIFTNPEDIIDRDGRRTRLVERDQPGTPTGREQPPDKPLDR